jgi:hypothetical protein
LASTIDTFIWQEVRITSNLTEQPSARSHTRFVVFKHWGRGPPLLYLIGGVNETGALDDSYIFDTGTSHLVFFQFSNSVLISVFYPSLARHFFDVRIFFVEVLQIVEFFELLEIVKICFTYRKERMANLS